MRRRVTSPALVGRGAELAELEAALERAISAEPSIVVIDGEAGLGKTRLASRLAELARAGGATVLQGSAVELAEGSLPYAPLVGVLRDLAVNLAPAELVDVLGSSRLELANLVPELGRLTPADGHDPRPSSLSDQTQLFEAVLGVTERLGRLRPTLIVLEDLQWTDRSTLDLLVFLVRNLRVGRLLLLITLRTEGLGPEHPLEHVLGELTRDRRTIRISLAPLDPAAIAEQVRAIAGEGAAPDTIERIQALSDGNPFFVEELLAAAPDHADGGVPVSLRRLLVERYRRLSGAARAAARVVAIAGEAAGDELISRVAELPERELYAALRETVDEHVLVPVEDPDGERYGFRHALLGEAIETDLLPGERRGLHAAIAAVLAEYPTGGIAGSAAALAHHWTAAGRWPEALAASIAAGQAAIAVAAYAEAAGQLDRAAGLWERIQEPETRAGMSRADLVELAADAAFLAGDFDGAVRLARQAAELAGDADRPLDAARARRRLGSYLSAANDDEGAVRELAEALRLLPSDAPASLRARILATQGAAEMLLGRYRDSAATCRQVLDLVADPGDPALEGAARNFLGVDLVSLGQIDDGLAELQRAVDMAIPEPDARLEAIHNLAGMLDLVGRSTEALEVARTGIALAGSTGLDRRSGAGLRAIAGMSLARIGAWAEADAMYLAGLALDPRGEHLVSLLRERGRLLVGLGRIDEGAESLSAARGVSALDRRVDSQTWLSEARIELELWLGRPDDALALVEDGLALLAGTDDVLRVAPLCRLGLRAQADRAELARARREASAVADAAAGADRLIADVRAIPTRVIAFGGTVGPVAAAEMATAEAEWERCHHRSPEDTLTAWRRAAACWGDLAMPYPTALARFRAAEAALEGRVDHGGAATDLRAAAEEAHRLGATPLARLVADLARRARIDLAGTDASNITQAGEADGPTGSGPAIERLGLTPREVEVLGLVAEGQTNRQIAEALFITEKTAGVHLTNILAKLGVPNRVEAGAVARRLAIVGGSTGPIQRTFLFTDIVRSTNLIEAIGDPAWVDLLGWHDRTLRAAFIRGSGEEIDHAGDGFFVAFRTAEAAATCAIAIQRALAEHRRAHGFAPAVRIGIHTGEAVRSGNGYVGRAIHEAARIAGSAAGGEIVASVTTRLPVTIGVGPARAVALKGLVEPVELVRIDWEQAPSRS